jgi:uncharacterized protein (DUF488 family)
MIYTSNYDNIDRKEYHEKVISISGDRGRQKNFVGYCYPALAPKKGFWKIWHENIGKIPEEENTKYYIREYYDKVLSSLDCEAVYNKLNEHILLCYEEPDQFCHRQIVASWFELLLGEQVPEVVQVGIELKDRTNRDFVKNYLEEVIKERTDMKGFHSLFALRLYEKAKKLEDNIRTNNDIDVIKILKDFAYDSEAKYVETNKNKCKKVEI